MAVLQINTSQSLERYVQQTQLDGQIYTLTFRWNRRNAAWYLDIGDQDGVMLVAGRRLVTDSDLGGQFRHLEIPPGVLTVFDTTGRRVPPELADLGLRALLLYFDSSEAF